MSVALQSLTLNKNVFYTQPLLTPMTWAHTTLASDLQPINLHCSIFLTHLREPQQLGRKVTLLLPQENAFLFSKSTKKVASTAATSLWNPSKDLFKLTLDKHYVSVTPTFFFNHLSNSPERAGKTKWRFSPCDGPALHTAEESDGCPDYTNSCWPPECELAGASLLEISCQNRCGF